jgi:hypothetical protein
VRRSDLVALAGFLFTLIAAPRNASAWCRTTTSQDFVPTSAQPCDDGGRPLLWASKCVSYSVQRDASRNIDLATTRAAVAKAFGYWHDAECPADPFSCSGPFDQGHPSIEAQDLGPVTCNCVEYNGKVGNANTIMYRDNAWADCNGQAKDDADTTLALTTVTFNTDTGEIYDADMEINTANNPITVDAGGVVVYDLQSILTHETGHFLGLAHTQPEHKTSTMFARYDRGQTFMRDPAPDDVCGMCAAYPPTRPASCDPAPRRGLALECGGGDPETEVKGGCHCAVLGGKASGLDVAFGAFAVALVVGAARRRQARRAR